MTLDKLDLPEALEAQVPVYLTPRAAAEYTGIGDDEFYRELCRANRIVHIKHGNRNYISREALDEYWQRREVRPR